MNTGTSLRLILDTDSIVAVATPPGRGGIGVVRLSGADAIGIATALLVLDKPLAAGRVRVARVPGPDGAIIDEAVATCFAGPRSYTGEDVVEIAAHGAPVLLQALVRGAVAHGARLARPGEFTERAVLNGRLDLTQAEAVHDLVAARTLEQARVAAAQLGGSLGRAVAPSKQLLLDLIAQLEAGIDFAEDDLDLLPADAIAAQLDSLAKPLEALAATYLAGHVLREGFRLALVGRPNAGKSSLFNRLLAQDRAIVTAQPGTTRDPIAVAHALGGIPVELIDTAGLRAPGETPEHEAERIGMDRTRMALAEADVVLHVLDATTLGDTHAEDQALVIQLQNRAHLTVVNKCDLAPAARVEGAVQVSAVSGEGLSALEAQILHVLRGAAPDGDAPMLTTLRQHEALTSTIASLGRARATPRLHHELLLLDLYQALAALEELTGNTPDGAILARIFSTFCIGK